MTTVLTLFSIAGSVAALPSITKEQPTNPPTVQAQQAVNPPLAEPDIQALRSWMRHSLRPVLLEDEDIDPAEWPMLEFRMLSRDFGLDLELDVDPSTLLDR